MHEFITTGMLAVAVAFWFCVASALVFFEVDNLMR
jgi:hypothetical protein